MIDHLAASHLAKRKKFQRDRQNEMFLEADGGWARKEVKSSSSGECKDFSDGSLHESQSGKSG